MLSENAFFKLVEVAPLISIDFIVRNMRGEVLLGERVNRPAKGFWFVPGGRIFKDERIGDAFSRIAISELSKELFVSDASHLGVFQHFYNDSVAAENVTTHYIVLAYEVCVSVDITPPNDQHSKYRWQHPSEILMCDDVHEFTKDYFREGKV